jgi:hypothetical protein
MQGGGEDQWAEYLSAVEARGYRTRIVIVWR